MKGYIITFVLILSLGNVLSQEEEKKERNWTLNGYLKYMGTYAVTTDVFTESRNYLYDNLIHNRLNFKWYPFPNFKAVVEMRNRVFFGDQVRLNPLFGELTFRSADDFWTLSRYWEDSSNVVLHMMFDRMYAQYSLGKFEVKAGRQRINWGINMAWNPNDIFNAFSFFDFDYEERPGSDALLLKYYTGIASSIEIAGKLAENFEDFTGAALWKINYKNYDVQFLGGVTNENLVVGTGWAGNIKQAGFKGEGSYFHALDGARDTTNALVGTISLEYSWSKTFLTGSILYSSNGSKSPSPLEQLLYYSGNISAKYLSPYTWSGLVNATYQFHPLVNGGVALIGYPGSSDAFINPLVTISVLQSLDLDLIAQLLFNDVDGSYGLTNQFYYGRLKWSF